VSVRNVWKWFVTHIEIHGLASVSSPFIRMGPVAVHARSHTFSRKTSGDWSVQPRARPGSLGSRMTLLRVAARLSRSLWR